VVGYSYKSPALNAARLMYKEIELSGSVAGIIPDYYKVLDLIRKGRFKIDQLITSRYPLDQINEAFDEMRKGEAIRIIVEIG
jgi:S-(hydroxymethyl)glutathione dehydrogenase/alcohol dehydrogenase